LLVVVEIKRPSFLTQRRRRDNFVETIFPNHPKPRGGEILMTLLTELEFISIPQLQIDRPAGAWVGVFRFSPVDFETKLD
jgi:hypothetical protein